ncbi:MULTISPECIES: shikimate dehydrogenase [unclassified Caballeronia]|uniref:shikimate dehydrogenase family protein n=1 Tax=unclassified Caballeronia TaxID=2646786 RepID=UPI002859FA45|nr:MULTISPECIES: shikimate dehydrogenase [unclassified Caballeronia]MDR5754043.1 shikimate dehydrogenase [Caballeronia sp. LZ024]MDR5840422.1 shikimate dehydrogenase [Caballeronia sp. LZ031]
MPITGTTRLFFCIADPVDQVRAPEVFNSIFARHGIDAAMVPLRVPAARLEATLRALLDSPTVGGVSLSIPHKAAATSIVDHASPAALAANAVNAVRRNAAGELEGELFDGVGFMRSLARAGIAYAGRRVLVLGAGGAASAVTTALAAAGVGEIALFDPDRAKAQQLAALLRRDFGIAAADVSSNDPAGYDVVVNASPLGLKDSDPLPVDVARIDAKAAVCDILMKNQPTPLLRAARSRGLTAEPGFDMLILQTPLYLDFFGYPELAESVRADDSSLRELLVPEALRRSGTVANAG